MNVQPNNYNIEDTGALMTRAAGGGRNKRIIIIAAALIAVLAIALVGWKLLGDKRYNDQIEIAEKEFIEGNYEQAETAYLEAVKMKKRRPKAREGLAYTYAIQGKTEEAIKEYDKLFSDFKEEKHENASRGLKRNGTLPVDPDLAPAQGKWRQISKEQTPYYDSLETYLKCMYTSYFCWNDGKEFDSNNPEGFPAMSVFMTGLGSFVYALAIEDFIPNSDAFGLLVEGEWVEGADPRKWSQREEAMLYDSHQVYDAEAVDSLLKDVFNLTDKDIERLAEQGEQDKQIYKQDGKYYCVYGWPTGAADYATEVTKIWTDGNKYCIQHDDGTAYGFDDSVLDRNEQYYTYYTIVEPKLIGDKHYWSLYYNGLEMPDEIKGVKDITGDDEPEDEPNDIPEEKPEKVKRNELVIPDGDHTAIYGNHATVNSTGGLNLRYGPGMDYDVIMGIPDGASVIEKGWDDDGEWLYVSYNDNYGWVKEEYITYMVGGKEKPVIYLYPTRTTDVRVQVSLTDAYFTKTIPAANNGVWNVTADPNGRITDKASGKSYDYLFWESSDNTEYDWSKGYVVAGIEAEGFLKKTLPKMGLNKKESEEFTEYWLPRLQKNKYNLVTFQTKCYTDAAKLNVNPKPDSMLRVFMAFKEISKPIPIEEPTIIPFKRKGFAVVEWGGAEVR